MKPSSNSSGQTVPFQSKLDEWFSQFMMRIRGVLAPNDFTELFLDLSRYDEYLRSHSNTTLQEAQVLEIGYGARPLRLMALISLGVNARGVDLDQPSLTGSPKEIFRMLRTNGAERALKSAVRMLFFDTHERRQLSQALWTHNKSRLVIDPKRFIVDDAASAGFSAQVGEGVLDLIFSEDVFEHIPTAALQAIVGRMAGWLKPSGLALITPNIWTGIIGGHLTEWYPHTMSKPMQRKSEPWEHLRKGRFQSNTYLNQMTRAEYRELFREHFNIIEEVVKAPQLGSQYLTEDVRRDLGEVPEDELFSNNVLFVLRRKV